MKCGERKQERRGEEEKASKASLSIVSNFFFRKTWASYAQKNVCPKGLTSCTYVLLLTTQLYFFPFIKANFNRFMILLANQQLI